MAVPIINESARPLVRVVWRGDHTPEDIDAHFDQVEGLVVKGGRIGLLMDMRDVSMPNAAVRQRAGERLKALALLARRAIVCNAHVVSSTTARGILTAVYWFAPPPFETKVFTDMAQAEGWVRERIKADLVAGGRVSA